MTCIICGAAVQPDGYGRIRARCDEHRFVRKDAPDSLVDHTSRIEDDPWAMEIARRGGATLEIVGDALGLTRERVRQIEEKARKKLAMSMPLVGIDASDIAAVLATRPGQETGYVPEPGWRAASYGGRTPKEARVAVPDTEPSEYVAKVDAAIVELERIVARLEAACSQ